MPDHCKKLVHRYLSEYIKCMKFAWNLKYGVWYSIHSVIIMYSEITVMVGQNRYSKLQIPSQLHTLEYTMVSNENKTKNINIYNIGEREREKERERERERKRVCI